MIKKSGKLKMLVAALGMVSIMGAGVTYAADKYPDKPITIIVPYGPGGTTDIVGRAIAESISKQLGQPVIIENKPGAAGSMGVIDMLSAKPDGYRLTLTPVGIFRQPYLQKTRYDPIRDITYIASFLTYDFAVTVGPDSPFKTVEDLVVAAKANPGEITYSTPGQYTGNQVVLAALGLAEDVEFSHIPYKGDAGAIAALLGGHTDVAVVTNSVLPHLQSGRVRVLATADAERNNEFGDIPTLKELGYEVIVPSPLGLGGPAGLPQEIVDTLDNAIKKSFEDDNVKNIVKNLGVRTYYLNSKDYSDFAKKNFESEKNIVNNLGLDK